MEPLNDTNIVYFIGMDCKNSPIKVGVSTLLGLKQRMASLQTGCPYKLNPFAVIPLNSSEDAYSLEELIHTILESYRTNGEWFICDKVISLLTLISLKYNALNYDYSGQLSSGKTYEEMYLDMKVPK